MSRGRLPSVSDADFVFSNPSQPDQGIAIPNTEADTYYIMIRLAAESDPQASKAFTLLAQALPFGATSVEPSTVGAGEVTLRLLGGHLELTSGVRLHPSAGGPDISAVKIRLAPDAVHLRARFDLTGVTVGTFDLVTRAQSGQEVVLPQAVTVEAPREIHIETTGTPSPFIRSGHSHNTGVTRVVLENTSNVDAPIVMFHVQARNGDDLVLSIDGDPPVPLNGDAEWVSTSLWFESVAPGERIDIPVKISVGPGFMGIMVQIAANATVFSRNSFRDGVLTGPGGIVERMVMAFAPPDPQPELWTEVLPYYEQLVGNYFDEHGLNPEPGQSRLVHWPPAPCQWVCLAAVAVPCTLTHYYARWACQFIRNLFGVWCYTCCEDKCAPACPGSWWPDSDCHPPGCDPPCPDQNTDCPWQCVMYLNLIRDQQGNIVRAEVVQHCVEPWCTQAGSSTDPNLKVGPLGWLSAFWLPEAEALTYRVYFENDPNAALPAALVAVDDSLDPGLDTATFRVNSFQFGSNVIDVPPGRSSYQTIVDLRPEVDLLVDVHASMIPQTGVAQFVLQALDPNTMQPPSDPTAGFLPPNDETGRGEGYVEFTVAALPEAASGTVVTNQATITFDYNDPMTTNAVFNTIDAGTPSSEVSPLPSQTSLGYVHMCWTGADDPNGCGIAAVTIFGAEDNGPYEPGLTTDQPCADYTHVRLGHSYKFYSVATDYVGHIEPPPTDPNGVIIPDATTTIVGLRGDANCDGVVNFDDISSFVLALSDPATYQATLPNCNFLNNDCNDDGAVNFDDINPFVTLLSAPPARGDLNCDGIVSFDDINPFVLALSDPVGYQAAFPNCNILNGDCNSDGVVNFDDINAFVDILSGG